MTVYYDDAILCSAACQHSLFHFNVAAQATSETNQRGFVVRMLLDIPVNPVNQRPAQEIQSAPSRGVRKLSRH